MKSEIQIQHTPGPWYGKKAAGGSQGLIIEETTGKSIAVAYDVRDIDLLAVAPVLLEALQETADQLQHYLLSAKGDEDAELAYQHARAAIAKARP